MGMKILRTPDERFDGLADYPFAPHYCEIPATAAAGGWRTGKICASIMLMRARMKTRLFSAYTASLRGVISIAR